MQRIHRVPTGGGGSTRIISSSTVIHSHSLRNIKSFETTWNHMKPTFGNEQKQADRTSTCEYGKKSLVEVGLFRIVTFLKGLFKYEV